MGIIIAIVVVIGLALLIKKKAVVLPIAKPTVAEVMEEVMLPVAKPIYPYKVGDNLRVGPKWAVQVVGRRWDNIADDWVFTVRNPDGSITEWEGWLLRHQYRDINV